MKKIIAILSSVILLAGCKAGPVSLFVEPSFITLKVGETKQFTYGVNNDFDGVVDISKIKKILVVDDVECVEIAGTNMKGIAPGTATFILKYDENLKLEAQAKIVVTE